MLWRLSATQRLTDIYYSIRVAILSWLLTHHCGYISASFSVVETWLHLLWLTYTQLSSPHSRSTWFSWWALKGKASSFKWWGFEMGSGEGTAYSRKNLIIHTWIWGYYYCNCNWWRIVRGVSFPSRLGGLSSIVSSANRVHGRATAAKAILFDR